jgi:hypothetical protein
MGEDAQHFFTGQLGRQHLLRRELRQPLFLFRGRWRINTIVGRRTELTRKLQVEFAGIAAHARGNLRR